MSSESRVPRITNFGGNLSFVPERFYTPRSEQEVLRILEQNKGRRIRAQGRLHSWSAAPVGEDVYLDLRHLNQVVVSQDEQGPRATLGAGCRIKHALRQLARLGLTLSSIGLIDEQTIAGATATGTHGSGRQSLSHYLIAVRIAHYDAATGEPTITDVCEGDALRAARCSLGCLGIVLAVTLRPRASYNIEERIGLYDDLDWIDEQEREWHLQQFYYVPWLKRYLVQRRKETTAPRKFWEPVYRAYWFLAIDCGMHVLLRFLVQTLRSAATVKFFFKHVAVLAVPRTCRMVGRSQDLLTMQHELFRHIEIEIFVRRSQLEDSLQFVAELIEEFDGATRIGDPQRALLAAQGLGTALDSGRGTYTHHYPVCVRRVLPDDTLISMASGGDEDYFALSFISYARPAERGSFLVFAQMLAHSMAILFDARCHWGKVCPATAAEVRRAYPRLEDFRTICRQFDPQGRFQNDWVQGLLFDEAT